MTHLPRVYNLIVEIKNKGIEIKHTHTYTHTHIYQGNMGQRKREALGKYRQKVIDNQAIWKCSQRI